jgi:LPXTG-motif cell wall-anchored protein
MTNSNGSVITSYTPVVMVGGVTQTCTNIFDSAGSYCSITGLVGGQIVTASVTATNAIGTSSAGSAASLVVIGVVGAPTSLVATPGDGILSIAFNLVTNGDSVSYYAYSLDGTNFVGLSGTSSPVVIRGLTNGTSYTVYLKAAGSLYGMGNSSAAVTATPVAPEVPTTTTVTTTTTTTTLASSTTAPAISMTKVKAAEASRSDLPATGTNNSQLVLMALLFVVAGSVLLVRRRVR